MKAHVDFKALEMFPSKGNIDDSYRQCGVQRLEAAVRAFPIHPVLTRVFSLALWLQGEGN
jgi:hypothetical protein